MYLPDQDLARFGHTGAARRIASIRWFPLCSAIAMTGRSQGLEPASDILAA